MLDGVENAQAGVGAVAGQQDHFDPRMLGSVVVQTEQLAYQRKSHAGAQVLLLACDLVLGVSRQPLRFEDLVALTEVEQRA